MIKTWQVGVITFLLCSIIFLPIGVIVIILYRFKHRHDNDRVVTNTYTNHIEDCRNAYKKDWDKLV